MPSSYMIAEFDDGLEGLTTLDALTVPVPDPQAAFYLFQDTETLGDGSALYVGFPSAEWRFPQLSTAQAGQLAELCSGSCAQVYLTTPDNTYGSYKNYLGFMTWPIKPPVPSAGFVKDLVITFTMLEEQEAEPE